MAGARGDASGRQASRRAPMSFAYLVFWWLFRGIFATYFRWRILNAERVPMKGPVILAANHASFLDPPLIGAALKRPLNYLARDTLFKAPVVGSLLRAWKVVPVDREGGGAAGLRSILDRLLAGGAILLFPEGTRTPTGQLQPARSGIGLAVIKSTAPVVPVRIFGSYEAYGRDARFPRPHQVTVQFGQPMEFQALRAEALDCPKPRLKQIYQQVAQEIIEAIGKLEPESMPK